MFNKNIPQTSYFFKDGKKLDENGESLLSRRLTLNEFKTDYYSEIIVYSLPIADAITRRLKKMINIIFKLSNENIKNKEENDQLTEIVQ